jgi:hypothetical protein
VAQCFTPEVAKCVAALRAEPAVQVRIEELAEKCNEGTITPEESAESDASIHAMDVIAVRQKQARTLIAARKYQSDPNFLLHDSDTGHTLGVESHLLGIGPQLTDWRLQLCS